MLDAEVAGGPEREGGDAGVRTEEVLVVAVVADRVVAGGIVVDQAEIVLGAREDLGQPTEVIQAFGQWAWNAGLVAVLGDGF